MTSLSTYRKRSIYTVIAMAAFWLLSLIALWNSVLNTEVKNEGWVVVFVILVFLTSLYLFYLAYVSADNSRVENVRKTAYESGKNEILAELERKKQVENERKLQEENINGVASHIISSVQGTRSLNTLCSKLLSALAKEIGLVQGIIYLKNNKEHAYLPVADYAITDRKPQPFKKGDSLSGQVAESGKSMIIYDIPEQFFVVASGLGKAQPKYLFILPVLENDETIAVMELALFSKPDQNTEKILDIVFAELGPKIQKYITD
jgi:hypothetical protein